MTNKELGKIIRKGRLKRDITQEELAAFFGMTKAAISKWENGITSPPSSMLMDLAIKLDIVSDLFPGYERKEKGKIKEVESDTENRLKKLELFMESIVEKIDFVQLAQ